MRTLLLLLLLSLPARAQDAEEPYHILGIGGEEVIELDFVPEKTNLQSSVLKVMPAARKDQIRVMGIGAGKASFLVRNMKGEVSRRVKFHVIPLEKYQRYTSVKRLLKDIKGTKVGYEGDNIVVDGTASAKDIARINKVQSAYPEILNLVNEK